LKLAQHFRIPAAVCINKWDLHPELTERIEADARAAGAIPVGRVRYDKAATAAQREGLAVVEAGPGPLADDIRAVWTTWMAALDTPAPHTAP
jgi:MinD superfamily P-loop ATPase